MQLTDQKDAIRHFIEQMDIEMIDQILDDGTTYQDFEKHQFISKLQLTFDQFMELGDTSLISCAGVCDDCDKGQPGYTFVGNNSGNYMSIIFETENGEVQDLYECLDFKNKRNVLKLNERVFIDRSEYPF